MLVQNGFRVPRGRRVGRESQPRTHNNPIQRGNMPSLMPPLLPSGTVPPKHGASAEATQTRPGGCDGELLPQRFGCEAAAAEVLIHSGVRAKGRPQQNREPSGAERGKDAQIKAERQEGRLSPPAFLTHACIRRRNQAPRDPANTHTGHPFISDHSVRLADLRPFHLSVPSTLASKAPSQACALAVSLPANTP